MFTGLVQSLAEVRSLTRVGPGVRLVVADAAIAARTSIGGSVAINGCCLTAVEINGEELGFDAGELERIAKLHDAGKLSDEEFAAMKAKIVG